MTILLRGRSSSAQRAWALLTGRNHHVDNAGAIMELATGFPRNTGVRPNNVTPLAEILRQNGYSTAAEPPHRADYHFTTDMTDQAISWVSAQQSLTPDKPFYLYFAPGATHAPHHVPKEWIAKYKGQFSGGWDKLREETFARQNTMGVIPADARLTPRPKEIPAWDDMSADQRRLFERQMETFAGFASHTDRAPTPQSLCKASRDGWLNVGATRPAS